MHTSATPPFVIERDAVPALAADRPAPFSAPPILVLTRVTTGASRARRASSARTTTSTARAAVIALIRWGLR